MGYLVDWQIRELCEWPAYEQKPPPLIDPFERELVNQMSIDVRLGPEILISMPDYFGSPNWPDVVRNDSGWWLKKDLRVAPYKEYGIDINPGSRVLGSTVETFNLPDDIVAFFHLKSSRAREGIGHPISGLCDPGWNSSVLTLELTNTDPHRSIKLYNNLLIGQMTFYRLDTLPLVSYNKVGHYNGDRTVTASKMNENRDKIWYPKDGNNE